MLLVPTSQPRTTPPTCPQVAQDSVVDGVVRTNTPTLVQSTRLPTAWTPPVDARLLHVDQILGVVHDAVRVHVREPNFRAIRLDVVHGAKVLWGSGFYFCTMRTMPRRLHILLHLGALVVACVGIAQLPSAVAPWVCCWPTPWAPSPTCPNPTPTGTWNSWASCASALGWWLASCPQDNIGSGRHWMGLCRARRKRFVARGLASEACFKGLTGLKRPI